MLETPKALITILVCVRLLAWPHAAALESKNIKDETRDNQQETKSLYKYESRIFRDYTRKFKNLNPACAAGITRWVDVKIRFSPTIFEKIWINYSPQAASKLLIIIMFFIAQIYCFVAALDS